MGKKRRFADILCVVAVALGVMVFALIVDGLAFLGMKYVFHLDFSQEYRQVKEISQLRFWKSWDEKVYIRYPFGLRPIEKREDVPEQEKPMLSWLDGGVYDVTDFGESVAWYDWKKDAVFIGNAQGEIQKTFEVVYDVEKLAFSPDERYLLVYEIDYRGEITDDEYCYYRVIDLENGTQYTVYAGYREWFRVYWEEQ
ncbi:MAG: hypothetical protein K1W31_11785 [Lachnospiraceae bacterium]